MSTLQNAQNVCTLTEEKIQDTEVQEEDRKSGDKFLKVIDSSFSVLFCSSLYFLL